MFHDQEFLRTIRGRNDCKEIGLPCGTLSCNATSKFSLILTNVILFIILAGHWIAINQEEATIAALEDFFKM